MTQAHIAEHMKMEPESISRFERNVTLPSLAALEKLAGLLDTTIAALLSALNSFALVAADDATLVVDVAKPAAACLISRFATDADAFEMLSDAVFLAANNLSSSQPMINFLLDFIKSL